MSKSKSKKDIPAEERRIKPRMAPYQREHTDWRNLLLEDDWTEEETDEQLKTSKD